MAPYTKVLPKGLLPVGEQPILEILVRQLHYYGFNSITMTCGYLAPLIQTYFGDGSKWNVTIHYEMESKPLGTIGPIKQLSRLTDPFLVINCDVLTTLNFRSLWDFHRAHDSILTIASQRKDISIDLGVLEVAADRVTGFLEKPTQSALVSMGVYVMDADIRTFIREDEAMDLPELVHEMLRCGASIKHFSNEAYWQDIGRPSEYMKANEMYAGLARRLLPDVGL